MVKAGCSDKCELHWSKVNHRCSILLLSTNIFNESMDSGLWTRFELDHDEFANLQSKGCPFKRCTISSTILNHFLLIVSYFMQTLGDAFWWTNLNCVQRGVDLSIYLKDILVFKKGAWQYNFHSTLSKYISACCPDNNFYKLSLNAFPRACPNRFALGVTGGRGGRVGGWKGRLEGGGTLSASSLGYLLPSGLPCLPAPSFTHFRPTKEPSALA